MKKINTLQIILGIGAIILIALSIWYIKKSTPPAPAPAPQELFPPSNELHVRQLDFFRRYSKLPSEMDPKILTKSLHGGNALFVGAYRMELSIRSLTAKQALWGIFIDNMKVYPILPKDTQIVIELPNKQKIDMIATRNGFLSALGPVPQIGQTVRIYGKINRAGFTAEFIVPELVKSFDVEKK